MPDTIVDLVVTSPPYNLNIDYAHYKDVKSGYQNVIEY